MSPHSHILIFGAGIIGLSLALELRLRGHAVEVFDPAPPLNQASSAAAGMLAADDPFNPVQLQALARYSVALYPGFLARLQELSGLRVPFQTERTRQVLSDGSTCVLAEHSLDPRQLAPALLSAALKSGVELRQGFPAPDAANQTVVHAQGAWSSVGFPITPRKGQMLRVRLPREAPLLEVVRSAHTYVVPRTQGPQAGTALVGATLEDAGFDTSVTPKGLADLRCAVGTLLPGLEDVSRYPEVETWAGLRPTTPDELPVLGEVPTLRETSVPGARQFMAAGHFRNGILLAPATAAAIADLIEECTPAVDLRPFAPTRFQRDKVV